MSRRLNAAVKRLASDLKEVQANPLVTVSAEPVGDDYLTWHCNLVGNAGTPFEGGVFHIEIALKDDYPSSAPSARFATWLPYSHGAQTDGRICLDILSDFAEYHSEWKSSQGSGWSSAYTIHTLLLNLQSFLLDTDTSCFSASDCKRAVSESRSYKCAKCNHNGAQRSTWCPAVLSETEFLEREQELRAASAGPAGVESEIAQLQSELVCYHSKHSYKEAVLGYGIEVTTDRGGVMRELSSPCEYLSHEAFHSDGVRHSVTKKPFQQWLPLYIDSEHYKRAQQPLQQALSRICTGSPDKFQPSQALQVFPKLLNSMVVAVMKGDAHASSRFLDGFCAFHRMFLQLADQYSEVRAGIDDALNKFIKGGADSINKTSCPNLGEWLALLAVARDDGPSWLDVAPHYLNENMDRCVLWYSKSDTPLGLAQPNAATDARRIQAVFDATAVSRSLLCFQTVFLKQVARPEGRSCAEVCATYDARLGVPTEVLRSQLQQACRQIQSEIGSWEQFFAWIGVQPRSDMLVWLRQSVSNSERKGYHTPGATGAPQQQQQRGGGGYGGRGGRGGRGGYQQRGGYADDRDEYRRDDRRRY
eukprot:TRINITY_DN13973_c0_g1_i1.p1 TRINITY_DN13973_c0_g1~~TRINITY_DN13973_c0_g1_i1.p1  ORF type:complete len:588 (-),score=116.47 TRINITY_DN13973_c0_g1_i1:46-1809(-)